MTSDEGRNPKQVRKAMAINRSTHSTSGPRARPAIADFRIGLYDSAMPPARPYANAPITEAIIDLRVTPRAEFVVSDLADIELGREALYPTVVPMFHAEGTITLTPDTSPAFSAQQTPWGYKFTSVNGKSIWQSRTDGFTFSQLAPYASWLPFRNEARRLWTQFRNGTQPQTINRLALRYINRIDVPSPSIDLKEYFRTSPEISPDLPQELTGYFMQLTLPQSDLGGEVLINQTIIPPPRPDMVSVVLDIDLFSDQNVPQSEEAIWDFFERLHVRKNEVFEACITDQTRRLFESCL